ncbi:transposase [Microcoleus sp. F6_B6]
MDGEWRRILFISCHRYQRDRAQLETMLGKEFALFLSSDDFSVYNGAKLAAQQKCLADLRRHFKKVLGLGGQQ